MENKHKTFKPYDRVLVRGSEDKWQIDFYSHWNNEKEQHITLAYGDGIFISDDEILPYEGNEGLLGSTDEPVEEIKLEEGEWIVVSDFPDSFIEGCCFRSFERILEGVFVTNDNCWVFAIPFKAFNPDDMEETRKHILCVKNGKVVRYHGKD